LINVFQRLSAAPWDENKYGKNNDFQTEPGNYLKTLEKCFMKQVIKVFSKGQFSN